MPTSIRNNRGFTLVEMMSAMVILLVGLLGLIQAMNYAAQENFRSAQRDEAVMIAEQWMAKFRDSRYDSSFSAISTCSTCTDGKYSYGPQIVQSRMRHGGDYTVLRTTAVTATSSHIDVGVKVCWRYKNMSTSHEVHSVRYQD